MSHYTCVCIFLFNLLLFLSTALSFSPFNTIVVPPAAVPQSPAVCHCCILISFAVHGAKKLPAVVFLPSPDHNLSKL